MAYDQCLVAPTAVLYQLLPPTTATLFIHHFIAVKQANAAFSTVPLKEPPDL